MRILTIAFILVSVTSMAQTLTDLSGKELFGGLSARHIGPALMSGRVSDIAGHPSDNKVIYIGTAGGGVWKSSDGGVHFNSIFDEYCQSIGTVTVDSHDPDNTIWIGTGETWTRNSTSVGDGLYKSTDGGINWKKMGFANSERISSVIVHPDNPNEIYVGVLGSLYQDSEERGVYKSSDGGATWEKLLYVDGGTGCADLVMDPTNASTLYASFWEFRRTAWSFNSGGAQSALYKSDDGGKTWEKIHKGFPEGKLGRIAIAVAPSNNQILYSVVESEDPSKSGMYRSDDAGATWKHLNADFGLTVRPFYFSRIVVNPTNPDFVVKAGLFGSVSRDGGNTFKSLGSMHPDIHDIWFDVKDSEKMFVATDGGLYRSLNSGQTMEIIENLPICQFYHISVDNQTPYNIYGGLQDNGSWYGPSASPGGIEARDWEVIGVGDGFRVYPHPTQPHIMYSEMQGAETVWRYDSKARQVKTITPYRAEDDPKLRFNWNAALTTSPNVPDRLYMGSQFVHVSDDKGDTWRKISPDLTTNDPAKQNQAESGGLSTDNSGAENHCTIFTIAESPKNQKVIWVGTDDGNVQLSKDGGANWIDVTANLVSAGLPANTWCYHIEASVFGEGIAYAVFDGHTSGDGNTYLYKTSDYGATWTSIVSDEVYGFARSFQEDYENPNLLFLGTEFGLYVSISGGKKWMKFENNVPATAIHYMEMHEETNDLIMGTHGRGIIILDDISPLRQLTDETVSQKLAFMDLPEFTMDEESTFGGTSSETQFVGANPGTGARIVYYLSKRHTFGKMSMHVEDMEGNYVSSLSPGKKKGLNFVTWNFNGMAPKIASGKTFATGGFLAPRVPAGEYKIVVKKGKETFETTVKVKYPENTIFSLEERKRQREITMKLFDMNEELAYLVHEIDEFVTHAEKQKELNPKMKKSAASMLTALKDLKAELVITTGDNYVGRAENELREDLSEIYNTIGSNFGAPTKSQLANVALMESRFNEAKAKMDKIRSSSMKKYNSALEKNELEGPKLKSFEEYVKKD